MLVSFLAGKDLHPAERTPTLVGLLDGSVQHTHGGAPDIPPGAIALHKRDDRMVRHLQLAILDGDFLSIGWDFDSFVFHNCSSPLDS